MANYERNLTELKKDCCGFDVFGELRCDVGVHPEGVIDYECGFAAYHISKFIPKILDIGSNRHFLLGLLAHFQVATIDIRSRRPISDNEVVITSDAKNLNLPDNSFDVVVSLCALEHFGLGRYGDEFDLDAEVLLPDKSVGREQTYSLKRAFVNERTEISSYLLKRFWREEEEIEKELIYGDSWRAFRKAYLLWIKLPKPYKVKLSAAFKKAHEELKRVERGRFIPPLKDSYQISMEQRAILRSSIIPDLVKEISQVLHDMENSLHSLSSRK